MKNKDGQNGPRLAMVEDKATERLKKRAQDLGLIVNAGIGKITEQADKKKDGARKEEKRK
ncbi:MAG TPA: hypothetical protein VF240_00360 [Pyrinomonadaceae bacterium]